MTGAIFDFLNAFFWPLVGIVWLLRNLTRLALALRQSNLPPNRWPNLLLPPLSLSVGFLCLHLYWAHYTQTHDTDNFGGQPTLPWQLGAAILGLILPPIAALTIHRLTSPRRSPLPQT